MEKLKACLIVALFALLCLGGKGCDGDESDSRENDDVERQQALYVRNQPPPQFDWSLERHLMTQLYQARNHAVTTYSYVLNRMTGHVMMHCTSLGYPIPATTQLTNPMKTTWHSSGGGIATIPQPEPNGLYAPSSTTATYVMCTGPDGNVEPVYVEDFVMTFPRPMREVNGTLEPIEGQTASVSINPRRDGAQAH